MREGRIAASARDAWREAWRLDQAGTRQLLTAVPEEGGLAADPGRAAINAGALGVPDEPSFLARPAGSLLGGGVRETASRELPDGESTGWWNRPTLLGGDAGSHLDARTPGGRGRGL